MENALAIQCGNKMRIPTGSDMIALSQLSRPQIARSGQFWKTLYQIMRAGFVLLLTTACASGQEFRITDRSPSFVISARVHPAVEPEYYVAIFTADYCAICQADRLAGKHAAIKKRWPRSVVIDVIADTQWASQARTVRVTSLPTVWLMKIGDDKVLQTWTGSTSIETIDAKIRILNDVPTGTKDDPISSCEGPTLNPSIYNGSQGSSHHCRKCLINHLFSEGIHRGRHSIQELHGLSDDQLNSLHNRDHKW